MTNLVPDGPDSRRDDVPHHALPTTAVLGRFGSDEAQGLPEERVEQLRSQYGDNELAEAPGPTLVLFVLLASLMGWPFPLTATQILWMNLVTNGLPALALGMEPPEPDLMRRRPRPPREPVITLQRGLLMLGQGMLVAAVTAVGFALVYQGQEANLPRARTVAFCVVSYAFIFYSLSCRSLRYTMPELGLFSNPQLLGAIAVSGLLQLSVVTLPFARPVFETATHFAWEWVLIGVLALAPVTLIEVTKLLRVWLCPHTLSPDKGGQPGGPGPVPPGSSPRR